MFYKDLVERALKTAAQAFTLAFLGALVAPSDVTNIGAWKAILVAAIAAGGGAAVSALTSLFSKKVGSADTASLVQ